MVALLDAEEEDDDVDDRIAHVDVRQVQKFAVNGFSSLVSEDKRKEIMFLSFSSRNIFT